MVEELVLKYQKATKEQKDIIGEQIYNQYIPLMCKYMNKGLDIDLLYIAFVEALNTYKRPYKFMTWLVWKIRSKCANVYRRFKFKGLGTVKICSIEEQTKDNLSLKDILEDPKDYEAQAINNLILQELKVHMTPKYWQILEWHFIQGYTQTEIANKLGTNQAQVCRAIKRALVVANNIINY